MTPGNDVAARWMDDPAHREWLWQDAARQLDFFRASLRADGGFDALDHDGSALRGPQELHSTTRMVHSYALGKLAGFGDCDAIIDAGMAFLWSGHRDAHHGGYLWSVGPGGSDDKLAYGHVFVLLAAASAQMAGHPDAPRLLADAAAVIERHFWDEQAGLLRDEFRGDWQPFSTYRGMNANMHGVEAMLAAHEVTGDPKWLARAGRILDFFVHRMAAANSDRIPEHYREDWTVDPAYAGNPMFRPAGTTPGHSLEMARLLLQHWDLSDRSDARAPDRARALVDRAFADGWRPDGGFVYTLDAGGRPAVRDRYWWPVTEAIGVVASLLKLEPNPDDEARYRALWRFAAAHFIDADRGGWFPEIDEAGRPTGRQFHGKPDIYHALQADLIPLVPGLARLGQGLAAASRERAG